MEEMRRTPNQKSYNTHKLRSCGKNNDDSRPRRSVHRNPPNYCEDAIDVKDLLLDPPRLVTRTDICQVNKRSSLSDDEPFTSEEEEEKENDRLYHQGTLKYIQKRKRAKKNSTKSSDDKKLIGLSEYERKRLLNIRENKAMMEELNLLESAQSLREKKKPVSKKCRVKQPPLHVEPLRRSLRLQIHPVHIDVSQEINSCYSDEEEDELNSSDLFET